MTEASAPRSYHRVITVALVLLNLLAILYAIYEANPGERDYYFREGSFLTWFFAAQMFGASLLFVACFFAGNVIPMEDVKKGDTYGWLVFAAGFFLLALDQLFRLREQLTMVLAGGQMPSGTYAMIKIIAAVGAIVAVIFFRAIVLANFRMVLVFIAGFWFLLLMLVFDMLFDGLGMSRQMVVIMEGSAKLIAMAMFVSAPFVVLLDRLNEARASASWANAERQRLSSLKDLPVIRPRAHQPAAEEKPAEAEPAEKVAEKKAETKPDKPAEKAEAKPAEKPAEAKPAEKAEAKPAETKPDKPAAEKKAEAKPAEKAAETPAEKKAEAKPAETKPDKPAEKKAAETPADEKKA